ncbi:MAG TPA: hypothetical protein VF167_04360 [Longimicrobiaceae bacterium]
MRILLAARPRGNPVIAEMASALEQSPEVRSVEIGPEAFWSARPGEFDVLHLHWPEALFSWREPSSAQLNELRQRLAWWREAGPIVATVHNLRPNDPGRRNVFGPAYEALLAACDGLIHTGRASLRALLATIPALSEKAHTIVPLPVFTTFADGMPREEARRSFGLKPQASVALSFGTIRRLGEVWTLLQGFRRARLPYKRLLVAGNLSSQLDGSARVTTKAMLHTSPRTIAQVGRIPDDEVQRFFKAADLLVISRLETLNSGNVQLGFGFGKVVVGPDTGVTGEILRATGNPVYRPGDADDLAGAMERALEASRAGKGEDNRAFAHREWAPGRIATMHVQFYRDLLGKRVRRTDFATGASS